jgi:hypothetical protein
MSLDGTTGVLVDLLDLIHILAQELIALYIVTLHLSELPTIAHLGVGVYFFIEKLIDRFNSSLNSV